MDFEVENQGKSMQKRIRKVIFSNIDFSLILDPFWKGLELQMEVKMGQS